ncbi:MAG: hypothetical protein Q8J90_11270 [Gallionella sp.]|nr:hypothetical protein [Gallionella sp.]
MTQEPKTDFPARVVEVVDSYRIVINRGAVDGIKKGQRFLIYSLGKELFDFDSKESLGRLEIVRGTGVISHVQERLSTVSSDIKGSSRKKVVRRQDPFAMFQGRTEEVIEEGGGIDPFEDASTGDFAKPI